MQAVKIATIVKLSVIGQGIFDNKAAALVTAQQLAVLAHKGSVVLAQASVFIELVLFHGHAAEGYTKALTGLNDFLTIIVTVI